MIEIIGGDPWANEKVGKSKPASYSRFILPFSYSLQKKENNSPKKDNKEEIYFKEMSSLEHFDSARVRYFTSETSKVLYDRATWAKIPYECWATEQSGPFTFEVPESTRSLQISIAPPTIVLFENVLSENENNNLLQHGFLILETHLESGKTHSFDDLLYFNELFRYYDIPYPEHMKKYQEALVDFPAKICTCKKEGKCTCKIGNCVVNEPICIYNNRWLSLLKLPLLMGGQFYSMVDCDTLACEKKHSLEDHLSCSSNRCLNYSDNRAFVWSCVIQRDKVFSMDGKYFPNLSSDVYDSGYWLSLLNVDSPPATPCVTRKNMSDFERDWLQKRTYQRWTEKGTFYGYCYHSGAMLAPPQTAPPLWKHFGQMYFDQILLLFYLRITLFAFSRNLTDINEDTTPEELAEEFGELRRSFAKFTNLYQFPLISNQQQGVEMYNLAREQMDIEDLFRDVRDEVTITHEFLEMRKSAQLAQRADNIATLGIPLAVAALVTSIVGVPQDLPAIVKGCFFMCPHDLASLWQLFVIAASGGIALVITKRRIEKTKSS